MKELLGITLAYPPQLRLRFTCLNLVPSNASYLQVVKENQRLHVLLKELVDDSATLSDLNILPGCYLWVMDTGLHENRDIAGIYREQSLVHTISMYI